MPYIPKYSREDIDPIVDNLVKIIEDYYTRGLRAGIVTYVICSLVNKALLSKTVSYAGLSRAIGVLECAKLEIYRRLVAPYEDKKREENGDVFSVSP